jgi:hypothetical protein
MKLSSHNVSRLGELVAAAFDEARCYSKDPKLVSQLATRAVADLMRRVRRASRVSSSAQRPTRTHPEGSRAEALGREVPASVTSPQVHQVTPAADGAIANWEGEGGTPT